MATIKISDLRPAGSDLFSDSEGYMNELGDGELDSINGGGISLAVVTTVSFFFVTTIILAPDAR